MPNTTAFARGRRFSMVASARWKYAAVLRLRVGEQPPGPVKFRPRLWPGSALGKLLPSAVLDSWRTVYGAPLWDQARSAPTTRSSVGRQLPQQVDLSWSPAPVRPLANWFDSVNDPVPASEGVPGERPASRHPVGESHEVPGGHVFRPDMFRLDLFDGIAPGCAPRVSGRRRTRRLAAPTYTLRAGGPLADHVCERGELAAQSLQQWDRADGVMPTRATPSTRPAGSAGSHAGRRALDSDGADGFTRHLRSDARLASTWKKTCSRRG